MLAEAASEALRARREAIVRKHVDAENAGDLDTMIASLHRFQTLKTHHATDAVIVEARMRGRQRAAWMGIESSTSRVIA